VPNKVGIVDFSKLVHVVIFMYLFAVLVAYHLSRAENLNFLLEIQNLSNMEIMEDNTL